MGWSDVRTPPPPPPGEWEAFNYGGDYRCWILKCGPVFLAHINQGGSNFYTTINGEPLPVRDNLQDAKWAVEREIIWRTRQMNTAYRTILQRAKMMSGPIKFRGAPDEQIADAIKKSE